MDMVTVLGWDLFVCLFVCLFVLNLGRSSKKYEPVSAPDYHTSHGVWLKLDENWSSGLSKIFTFAT